VEVLPKHGSGGLRNRRFEGCLIANSLLPAVKRQLFGVHLDDVVKIEKYRHVLTQQVFSRSSHSGDWPARASRIFCFPPEEFGTGVRMIRPPSVVISQRRVGLDVWTNQELTSGLIVAGSAPIP
jgi:hypothetical protein